MLYLSFLYWCDGLCFLNLFLHNHLTLLLMNWISDMNYFILILFLRYFLDSPLVIVDFIQLVESIILVNKISYLLVLINLFTVDTI